MSCWMVRICGLIWLPSFWVTLAAITGRETPQARPKACLDLGGEVGLGPRGRGYFLFRFF